MTNYDLKESTDRTYGFYEYELAHGDTKFLLNSALQYVVDDYDEYLCSVELSHYEDLGYYEIKNYVSSYQSEVLDLTWMNKEDIFNFDKNQQHQFIRQINANIDNLGFSHLPIKDNMFRDIMLVVYNNNSQLSFIKQIKNFKSFISEHASVISRGVKLEGFSPIVTMILEKYAKNYGLTVASQEFYNKKSK